MDVPTTTLAALQGLSDGRFHELCDALLPRREIRYRDLQPHGINPQGQSTKGQPDSYVGDTAAACRIAMCYSTERARWWTKAVKDVSTVVGSCRSATEIAFVTPRDVSREIPKTDRLEWLGQLRQAAAGSKVRVLGGRLLAHWLDRDHPDLRWEYLEIPYSRLSFESILGSARTTSTRAIARLVERGRYSPDAYVLRDADENLFSLWQAAWDERTSGDNRTIIIPVVSGSGTGKTSLLARFVGAFGASLPVLLVEARSLSFETPESLVVATVQALQGLLGARARLEEEAAIVHHLGHGRRLTVVVDALDEALASSPKHVSRALDYWTESRLGRASVLIVSCRPDAWRLLDRGSWSRSLVAERSMESGGREAAVPRRPRSREVAPGSFLERFSEAELAEAWTRTGRPLSALYSLAGVVREELRHPFTLRVYMLLEPTDRSSPTTRTSILRAWLRQRLDDEATRGHRISGQLLEKALIWTARTLAERKIRWLPADAFEGAPRFSQAAPPGEAIQLLVSAGLLETHPDDSTLVGFLEEAVLDYCLAEADVATAVDFPDALLASLAALSFTKAHPRVERLAMAPSAAGVLGDLGARLVAVSSPLAAVLVSARPSAFSPDLRLRTARVLATELLGSSRVDAAFAVDLLGRMRCAEAEDVLLDAIGTPATCPSHLRGLAAMAFARLGTAAAAPVVYRCPWFGAGGETYYFLDLLSAMRTTSSELRGALAAIAIPDVMGEDPAARARGLNALGYIGDARLPSLLEARLNAGQALNFNDHHALFALGTDAASAVLDRSARLIAAELDGMDRHAAGGSAWMHLFHQVALIKGDIQHLLTPEVHATVVSWVSDASPSLRAIGQRIASSARSASLTYAGVRHDPRTDAIPTLRAYPWIDPSTWLQGWRDAPDDNTRQAWLRFVSAIPTLELEDALISCLDRPKLAPSALHHLGRIGSRRARQYARAFLRNQNAPKAVQWEAIQTLRQTADKDAVDPLTKVATGPDADLASEAMLALGGLAVRG